MRHAYSAQEAGNELEVIINYVATAKEHIRITSNGKELVGIVPIEDLLLLEALEDWKDIREAKTALKEEGSVTLDENASYSVPGLTVTGRPGILSACRKKPH